jgi:hypothetical protein
MADMLLIAASAAAGAFLMARWHRARQSVAVSQAPPHPFSCECQSAAWTSPKSFLGSRLSSLRTCEKDPRADHQNRQRKRSCQPESLTEKES